MKHYKKRTWNMTILGLTVLVTEKKKSSACQQREYSAEVSYCLSLVVGDFSKSRTLMNPGSVRRVLDLCWMSLMYLASTSIVVYSSNDVAWRRSCLCPRVQVCTTCCTLYRQSDLLRPSQPHLVFTICVILFGGSINFVGSYISALVTYGK